jgi:glycosyltransferase involved in cell wall biosynthesis
MSPPARLAVLCDYREEEWPSMDRVADTLVERLVEHHADAFRVTRVVPTFRRRFTRLRSGSKGLFNADRLVNRVWEYPRELRPERSHFDVFHVADHTYAFLAHGLPRGRVVVFCHDLDSFKPITEPENSHPRWARMLARHVLTGMQRASVVFYSTEAVRVDIERLGLVPVERLVHAPYGVADVFAPHVPMPSPAPDAWPALVANGFLMHVGSCIPRKRIDVLLDVFAAIRAARPHVRLVQVGGEWSLDQRARIERLGLGGSVVQLRGIDNAVLAALYGRALAVLLTSEAEGFGLPVVEALACGAPVVASDLPVTREVGGGAVVYCPVGDVAAWSQALLRLLSAPAAGPSEQTRLARGALYSWNRHAGIVAAAYARLLGRDRAREASPAS